VYLLIDSVHKNSLKIRLFKGNNSSKTYFYLY